MNSTENLLDFPKKFRQTDLRFSINKVTYGVGTAPASYFRMIVTPVSSPASMANLAALTLFL